MSCMDQPLMVKRSKLSYQNLVLVDAEVTVTAGMGVDATDEEVAVDMTAGEAEIATADMVVGVTVTEAEAGITGAVVADEMIATMIDVTAIEATIVGMTTEPEQNHDRIKLPAVKSPQVHWAAEASVVFTHLLFLPTLSLLYKPSKNLFLSPGKF